MTARVAVPAANIGGLRTQEIHAALQAVATQAKADIEDLQALQSAAATVLTDAVSQTLASPSRVWGTLPTLGQGGTLTLGTTGAVAGDQFYFTRTSTSANTYAIVNGGTGAGTLITYAISKIGCGTFQFDGTDWKLKSFGVQ